MSTGTVRGKDNEKKKKRKKRLRKSVENPSEEVIDPARSRGASLVRKFFELREINFHPGEWIKFLTGLRHQWANGRARRFNQFRSRRNEFSNLPNRYSSRANHRERRCGSL